ncbi:lysine-N-methylase [Clostridium tetanomorphum]|nr:lysine-N-methylase [Clostridium tetanomorphum]
MLFFKCSADKCISHCCRGWKIQVEDNIIEKYKNIKDEELRNIILKNISRDPGIAGIYGNMKLTDRFECALIQNGLCYIHKNLGEEYLCNTCKTYPRHKNLVDNVKEMSATISCPEVAKLVLLNSKPMEFEAIRDFNDISITTFRIEDHEGCEYFWKLRMFTIEVLQYRKWDLNSRIKLLIMFYNKFNKDKFDIDNEIRKFKGYLCDQSIYEKIKTIGIESKVKVEMLKEIMQLNTRRILLDIKYKNLVVELIEGLELDSDDIENSFVKFENIKDKYYNEFFKEKEYIFENYLVNYTFQNLVPLGHGKNFFENIAQMIINLSIIRFIIIGIMGIKKEKFNEDDIIDIFHSFSRNFEHSNEFNKKLLKNLKKKGMLNEKWIMLLL